MKLRIAVLTLALGLFSSTAFAQPMLDYKAIGGIGFGTLSFDDDSDSEFFDGQRTGLIIGGGVDIPAGNVIVIGIEVLYNQKGASGSVPSGASAVGIAASTSVCPPPDGFPSNVQPPPPMTATTSPTSARFMAAHRMRARRC